MVDPVISGILLNLISSGIVSGINKFSKTIFRQEDIVDYLNSISFQDVLDQELDIEEISERDNRSLDIFFKSEPVSNIISQIYLTTDESLEEIENEFVRLFCDIKPVNEKSNERLAQRLFFCIKQACRELLLSKIARGDLSSHEYLAEERHKEQRDLLKQVETEVKEIASHIIDNPGMISSNVPVEYVDSELEESITLIRKNELEEAKRKLIALTGFLDKDPSANKRLLSRVYHLLAIAYNKIKELGGDFDLAEYYANLSLKTIPSNNKAKGTLASIYLNKGGRGNQEKSFAIAVELWEESGEREPQFLEVYLWGLFLTKSPSDAIEFFENSKDVQGIVKGNDILSNVIARFYLSLDKPYQSLEHINNSITLNPRNPDHLWIKAEAYKEIALSEDTISSDFELLPRLKKTNCVEVALENYSAALSLCNEKFESSLREIIKYEIYLCASLLEISAESEYQRIRFSINSSLLPENLQRSLEFIDFVNDLNCRHFSSASQKLFSLKEWEKFPYETKRKMGLIFLFRGSPEEAKKILNPLEAEAIIRNDFRYWFILGDIEALLNNKPGMLRNIERAKNAVTGSENEGLVFSYQYSRIWRYHESEKEIDRVLDVLKEHDRKHPENRILKEIPFGKNVDQPSQEIKDFIAERIEKDKNLKRIFTEHQVPSYILADVLQVTYVELINRLKDPTFYFRYLPPEKLLQQELEDNFYAGQVFVFDYSSLLNLAKMELLGEIGKIPGKLVVTKSLFDKVQSDLLLNENLELRRLWTFLRFSDSISIIDIDADPEKYEEIREHLDKWILDLIELVSRSDNSILISDDYNFIRLLKEFNVKGTLTLIFLQYLLENSNIDSKTYSLALGILADQMSIILPYDGEDLFQIVLDDNCQIRLRSYHLVNQITFRNVPPSVYTGQFVYFMGLLWRTGALYDDKKKWLSLITDKSIHAMDQCLESRQMAEVEIIKHDLRRIWQNVISNSGLSELTILENEIATLFKNESSMDLKIFCLSALDQMRTQLSENDTPS